MLFARPICLDSNVQVEYTGNRIETFNGNANGIYASTQSSTGTFDINATGRIITHSNTGAGDGGGIGSFGLQALTGGGKCQCWVYRVAHRCQRGGRCHSCR